MGVWQQSRTDAEILKWLCDCRRRQQRRQAARAASELSADDEGSLSDISEEDHASGSVSATTAAPPNGRQHRARRLMNGHVSGGAPRNDANGDLQHSSGVADRGRHVGTPPKSRRVRHAQVRR